MRRLRKRAQREPAISLINIIFLILIFFMVTGTLTQPAPSSLEFISTEGVEGATGSNALQITDDGALFKGGESIGDLEEFLMLLPDDDPAVRIAPDHRLPARNLLLIIGELRALGADEIVVVIEVAPS